MKPLVAMDSERSKFFPDLPTTVELGYPTVLSNSTRGFIGPKGISDPIIKKLQAAFQKAMEDPEHVDKMDKAGLATKIMMGEEYNKYVKGVHEKMKRLVEKGRKAR
jgi:tripartite-type tricarboxylate transporter receptor subunit TctC